MRKVYLAGPDVFAPDAAQRAEQYKNLCLAHGFTPLHPFDTTASDAQGIYSSNIELIKTADAVVANLNPFRGAEPDSGTAFEIGYATALNLPVIGYLDAPTTLKDQVKKFYGPIYLDPESNQWLDQNEYQIENFDLAINLMLGVPCHLIYGDFLAALIHLQSLCYD